MSINILDTTQESVLAVVARNTGLKAEDIQMNHVVLELCKGNIYKLGLILFDLHEIANKDITYNEEQALAMFATISDIVEYFKN